jgi:hypothetical protein
VSKLFGYQFSVEFKLGRQNVTTDALSHQHEEDTTVHALFIPNFALLDEFCVEAATLPEVIAKRIELTAGTTGPEWALVDDLWSGVTASSFHRPHPRGPWCSRTPWHGP